MEKNKEIYLFRILLETQIGKKSGVLSLSVCQNKIEGYLNILGRKQFVHGVLTNDGCLLSGQLKTLISVFDYTAEGYFNDQFITLTLCYKHGLLHLTGVCENYSVKMIDLK